MCLMTLVLLSENLFGAIGLLRLSADNMISPLILTCLVLLTWVVAMRQAAQGVWPIFVGAGIGSRIARGFAPILLVHSLLDRSGANQVRPARTWCRSNTGRRF